MDILDIDEALKDDSFIFLEDKTHDDVSNILQQWKSNNNFLPTQQQLQQQQQHQQQLQLQQQQHQQEQAYKLNSRTFTRPRKKSTQNLESQFLNAIQNNPQQQQNQQQNGGPILNLEIGGLVTTMHKSFLQDTSPPSSICSSMDVSIERMNNSLITSADFSNINFLQSTQSLDFNDANGGLGGIFNLADKSTSDGYTLSDMIRDRQALESLTMSGDGTLIKDTEIGQIDDISLLLSKTASSCSTMDNSTESVEGSNKTIELEAENRTYEAPQLNVTHPQSEAPLIMQRTMVLSEEMIGDTTFNLVDSSLCEDRVPVKGAGDGATSPNLTFKQPTTVMNETVCITAGESGANSTLERTQTLLVESTRCETPEQIQTTVSNAKLYESTPQATSVRSNKQAYTPSIKIVDDVNISPIVPTKTPQMKVPRRLNETYEPHEISQKVQSTTFSTDTPLTHLEAMDEELLDNVENPNETYNKSIVANATQNIAGMEMQSVMDLAQAEAELLADNDEEQFEHILNAISKVELNADQLKMKHSLDSIKKRFNCNLNGAVGSDKQQEREGGRVETTLPAALLQDEINAQRQFKHDMDLRNEDLRKLKESMRECRSSRETLLSSGLSNSSGSCGSGERLLSRRSRLYDDINLSTCNGSETKLSTSATASTTSLSTGSLSNTIPKTEDSSPEQEIAADASPKTEVEEDTTTTAASNAYKLAERRERDRERFRTIKIVKQRAGNGEDGEPVVELNVPCIDDDDDYVATEQNVETAAPSSQRYSRRDQVEIPETTQNGSKLSQNYLTYKKPRDKQIPKHKLPEITASEDEPTAVLTTTAAKTRTSEARSLSRPRFLSGLQKFSAVSKAPSAGDLEQAPNTAANTTAPSLRSNIAPTSAAPSVNFNRTQPLTGNKEKVTQPGELKSPMGIKSKSFHNLSSNFGYNSGGGSGLAAAPKLSTYGLRKPQSGGVLIEKQAKSNVPQRGSTALNSNHQMNSQKADESVFKVPRLVSGLRAPSTVAGRRALPVRPSSGYYSLNVNAKQVNLPANDVDLDTGRHSPTDSMSSASSRGSAQSIGNGSNVVPTKTSSAETLLNSTATLTKITTGSTGIPKPSGLKPPSNVKRSGLPRPASMIRR